MTLTEVTGFSVDLVGNLVVRPAKRDAYETVSLPGDEHHVAFYLPAELPQILYITFVPILQTGFWN